MQANASTSFFVVAARRLLEKKRLLFPNRHLASLPFIGKFFRKIVVALRSDFVEDIQGSKMYLDVKDTFYLSLNKIYEPEETAFFQNRIKEGHVVIDIGANIGYYTLLFAKLVGPEGHVYAFEPEPQCFDLLRKNVAVNEYSNVTLFNKAVSDRSGKLKLFRSETNGGDHRTYDSSDGRQFVKVEALRLDDHRASFGAQIDFIKMDIQGAEYRATLGMLSLLQQNPNVVLVTEFEPLALARSGVEPARYLELLERLGFRLQCLDPKEGRAVSASAAHLPKVVPRESGRHINLICSKSELFGSAEVDSPRSKSLRVGVGYF